MMKGYYCPFEDRNELFNELRNIFNEDWYAMTLGAGASVIAPYVKSTDTHMYILDEKIVISVLKLTPVEFGGNVYLIEPPDEGYLMNMQSKDGLKIVSNIQLYLDLYNYPKRGHEQANHLREKVLRI
ncbi:MAG: type IV toxin-antitoxin system AbiEi family antitoxin [Candidatus Thermoplasmatota archaeon]|nr:type IV toxin-antitoxin system AbiEi family antitoxin [Candidatus Thermoplasmatota archaeon]